MSQISICKLPVQLIIQMLWQLIFLWILPRANAGTLSFNAAQVTNGSGSRGGRLKVFWSNDGTTWTEFTGAVVTVGTLPYLIQNALASSTSITVTLPSAFNNSATARVRFYYDNGYAGTGTPVPGGNRPKLSIDNVSATSTPGCTSPTKTFNVTASTNAVCSGGNVTIGLSGSQATATYQLYAGGSPTGVTTAGTGGAITFAAQTISTPQTYTVWSTTATGGFCAEQINAGSPASQAVTIDAAPSISSQSTAGASYGQGFGSPSPLTVTATGAGLTYQWYSSTDAATNTAGDDIALGT